MATAGDDPGDRNDGVVRLWTLPSGDPAGRPLRYPTVGDISLSPDGRRLAVTRPPSGGVEIFDLAKRRRRASLLGAETVWDLVRFTPDGRYLVGGSYKGWARLWSVEEPAPQLRRRLEAGHPQVHRPRRTSGIAVDEPRRPHARHRRPRRHRPPLGPADAAGARRRAARPAEPLSAPRNSHPTAPICSPSPTPAAPTAGTSARPHGHDTPAPWPAAGSPEASGATRSPSVTTTPPAERHRRDRFPGAKRCDGLTQRLLLSWTTTRGAQAGSAPFDGAGAAREPFACPRTPPSRPIPACAARSPARSHRRLLPPSCAWVSLGPATARECRPLTLLGRRPRFAVHAAMCYPGSAPASV